MERLKKIGTLPKLSSDMIKSSRLGIGFEKLDRDAFDPEKAYDKVAALGVKWVRIQSGWQKTEKQKGVYDFKWMDSIIDNLTRRKLIPWVCLCYGNGIYDEKAAAVYGAVGVPPIFNDEQKTAWKNYVEAFVKRYKDKVRHYEIWNEPDGIWCWKHGVSGTETGIFTKETAKTIKSIDKNIVTIGGSVCLRPIAFLNEALSTGMGDYLDYISFHEYTHDETKVFERTEVLEALVKSYNPHIGIIQGESGSLSVSGACGALCEGSWTQEKQAKQLARHEIADLMTNVLFSSYFSCMDMVEALNGKTGDVASYKDFGYFGVLGAVFDENGKASGEYTPKPSYYTLQNICSLFSNEFTVKPLPLVFLPEGSGRVFGRDVERRDVISGGFHEENGDAFAYWYPSNIMTSSFEGTISFEVCSKYDTVRLVDVMDGSIYEIPEKIMSKDAFGTYKFRNLPIKDTPMVLVFGKFGSI